MIQPIRNKVGGHGQGQMPQHVDNKIFILGIA
ncbi:hypothetical protein EZS27_032697 [termite gut metagenome]|uniref:Uncharacterized protein n=1 Tax=termite gut metagenome TaxID=433724 RepID=A0A5J4Q626_9ZZZZ